LPSQFNDPFEAKPRYQPPQSGKEARAIRTRLINLTVSQGLKRKDAEKLVSQRMSDPSFFEEVLGNSASKSYQEVRACCFTVSNKNLLFWAHYANSHKGFCVGFDATILPVSMAYKIQYKDQYPSVSYPPYYDQQDLKPLLVKSDVWSYEEEYRTLLVKEARVSPHDNESFFLSENSITDIYLGSMMNKENQKELLKIISQSRFEPKIWLAKLSKTSYQIEFEPF